MAKATTYKGYSKAAEKLSRVSHFQSEEVDALLNIYNRETGYQKMDGNTFRDFLHSVFGLTEELMLERVCQVFDKDQDCMISEEEFVLGLSVFLKGTTREQIEYCFNVYDHNADGVVSRDEILQLLKSSLVNIPAGEEFMEVAKDLVELVVRRLDNDRDGRVSFEDYAASVTSELLLMQVLGSCLPNTTIASKFLSTLVEEYGRKAN